MIIKAARKVIKIGSSAGVTLPAKDLRYAGISPGDKIEVTIKTNQQKEKGGVEPKPNKAIVDDYQAFRSQYGQTLKNLADR